jgi:predicted patatin/cPLA2 family phospholipase
LGESKNLKKLIEEKVTQDIYDKIKSEGKLFGAAVTSLTHKSVQIKTTDQYQLKDMTDWIWASANTPIFMSNVYKEAEVWVDGGLREFIPITYILDNDLADEIDVIIHEPKNPENKNWKSGNILDLIYRVINILSTDVAHNDIEVSKLKVQLDQTVQLNLYFFPNDLVAKIGGGNSLIFRKEEMLDAYREGKQSVIDGTIDFDPCIIEKDGTVRSLNVV